MYDDNIPSICIDFGKERIHLIEPNCYKKKTMEIVKKKIASVSSQSACSVWIKRLSIRVRNFANGQAYITLSRMWSLEGLQIKERDCDNLPGKILCNKEPKNEIYTIWNYKTQN